MIPFEQTYGFATRGTLADISRVMGWLADNIGDYAVLLNNIDMRHLPDNAAHLLMTSDDTIEMKVNFRDLEEAAKFKLFYGGSQ
jgi:hypothetical protein